MTSGEEKQRMRRYYLAHSKEQSQNNKLRAKTRKLRIEKNLNFRPEWKKERLKKYEA